MNIAQFNARGPYNGIEHWFDLIREELINRGHQVEVFWLKGRQPTKDDIKNIDFAIFHFSQVALYYMRISVPYCILPSANDCFPDSGAKLKIASSHNNCKFVTYQSFYHKKKYDEWDIPKPKVYVPMPARTKLFKRISDIPNGEGIIAGGRLISKKGLDKIMHLDNLTIFGEGPLRESLQTMNPKVKFTGNLGGEELRDLMDKSWLFLLPSIITPEGDSEGMPNVLKEALLMRMQVIASPIAAIPELENIVLLNDWSNIGEVIETIPRQPNYKGEQEIRNIYSPENCVNKLLEAINEYGGL